MLYFGTRARLFKNASFQDPSIKRMLSKLQNIDKAALPKDELREVMDGAPRSPGACSPPQGWVGLQGGSWECMGQEGGWWAGQELPLGREGSGGWREDASARPSPSWWGWHWGWARSTGLPWVTPARPQYNKILAYMEKTYSTAQVCLNEGPCMPLEPGECPSPALTPLPPTQLYQPPPRAPPNSHPPPCPCVSLFGGWELSRVGEDGKQEGVRVPPWLLFRAQTSKKSWPPPGTRRSCCGPGRAGGMLRGVSSVSPLSTTCTSATRLQGSMVRPPPHTHTPGQPHPSRQHTHGSQINAPEGCSRVFRAGRAVAGPGGGNPETCRWEEQRWFIHCVVPQTLVERLLCAGAKEVLRMYKHRNGEGVCPLRAFSPLGHRRHSCKHTSPVTTRIER